MTRTSALCFGFTAIDYVCSEDGSLLKAALGGTAANVCAALNRLGVHASLVATIGTDARGLFAIDEMRREGLSTLLVEQVSDYATPFCIELLKRANGLYSSHGFRSVLLHNGERSSRFSPPSLALQAQIRMECKNVSTVFSNKQFDGIIDILDQYLPIFYYEPDCIDSPEMHRLLVSRSDIYKFNHEQFIDYRDDFTDLAPKIVIETFGSEGFRFRSSRDSEWIQMLVSGPTDIVDPTGAGDWFSASLLRQITLDSNTTLQKALLEEAVRFAAKISRLSCSYLGATGLRIDSGLEDNARRLVVQAHTPSHVYTKDKPVATALLNTYSAQ